MSCNYLQGALREERDSASAHTFEHELTVAVDNGFLGSIDANLGDAQNGWDTDQFPVDAYDLTQAMMQIIRNGGFGNGGTNFDAK